MGPILAIARRRGLFVLEDAAEAHGAAYMDQKVGGIGDAATFSFFGNKIITTGEGGMVTTRSAALAEKMRLLRGQGMNPNHRYWFDVVGYNYRMTNIEAAIGLAQTEQLDRHLAARRKVADWYKHHLANCQDFIHLPVEEPFARHALWMYTILLNQSSGIDRDRFMASLLEEGVETRPVFYPMHVLPPYKEPSGKYPVADSLARRGISLPTHALLTEDDVRYVASCIQLLCTSRSHAFASGTMG